MARKKVSTDVVVPSTEVVEGDILVLDGGQKALVVSVGSLMHTITQEVPVQIVSYELMGGEWAGARANASLLGSEELVIQERPNEGKSSWWNWLSIFRSG